MQQGLLDIFAAREGIVCLVGAGGKKTTLYRLAAEHPGRVGITATSHIERFPKKLAATLVIGPEDTLLERIVAAASARVVAFAQPSEKHGRYGGVAPAEIIRIHEAAGFDVCLVKADGARNRLIKAPSDREPPIPKGTHTVIPVLSARAIGKALSDQVAHRCERLVEITGARRDEPITPTHVARLLADPRGALKEVGDALVVPLINMVDDLEREALARESAERALSLTARFDRVVLAAMRKDQPIVDIVRR